MEQKVIDLKEIMDRAGGFAPECYPFIRDGLEHTATMIHGEGGEPGDTSRHVTGQQLCLGLRDYAVERYGLMAKSVLNHWGVHETLDFGRIIFAMVEAELMSKTEEDALEDFEDVFDFAEAFAEPEPTSF